MRIFWRPPSLTFSLSSILLLQLSFQSQQHDIKNSAEDQFIVRNEGCCSASLSSLLIFKDLHDGLCVQIVKPVGVFPYKLDAHGKSLLLILETESLSCFPRANLSLLSNSLGMSIEGSLGNPLSLSKCLRCAFTFYSFIFHLIYNQYF